MRVLSGTFDQSDSIRFPRYCGRQCSANAVAAVCKAHVLTPNLWTSLNVDECLMAGNKLFERSYEILPTTYSNIIYLRPDELYSSVMFPENEIKFQAEINSEHYGTSMNNISTVNHGIVNYCIDDAVLCFLHKFNYGVFTCQLQCVAIMKIGNEYFLFDSHKRGRNGLTDCQNGTAVLLSFTEINDLVLHLKNLFKCTSCSPTNTVQCASCQFTIIPILISNVTNVSTNAQSHCSLKENVKNERISLLEVARNAKKNKSNAKRLKQNNFLSNIQKKKVTIETTPNSTIDLVNKIYDLRIRSTEPKYERTEEMKVRNVEQIADRYKINAEVRETKTKQNREKYQTDEVFKKLHSSKMREKYQSNEEFKELHSSKIREKYQTDEVFKELHSSKMRAKYHNDELYHEKLSSRMREKYQTNEDYHNKVLDNVKNSYHTPQGAKRKSNYQNIYQSSKKTKICLHERFNEQKKEMPTVICTCCAQLFFKKSTVSELSLKIDQTLSITDVCTYRLHLGENESGNVCSTCANHLKKVTCLPRMDSEDDTLLVQLMRRMSDKTPYAFENVRPEKVFNAARYLVNTDLYKQHNITLNESWLQQFHDETNNSVNDPVSSSNTDESTEQADEIDDLMDQQETLLTSGFVADSGVKIAPGEGNMPLSLTLDEDMDVLAFPTVYGGKQRIFKVKYTPVEMAKAEARHHDRRVATNIPKVMMNFCKSRIHKLKSRVNINLRKK
ncbi:Microtubule-associated protein 1A, partial [Frankliniella fusca]